MQPKKNDLPLQYIVIEPPEKVNATLIGLHGLGTNGEDFRGIATLLQFAKGWNVRMIFPHAMQMPITINQNQVMPAWYNIKKIDLEREIDKRSVDQSHCKLIPFIEQEIENNIDSKRIILAGFSQGGAMAAQVALHFPKPLGGLVMLSAYLLNEEKVKMNRISGNNHDIPIFMGHGKLDEVVSYSLAKRHQALLKKKNYNVTWKTYESMGHSVAHDEMKDLSQWLQAL